MRQPRNWLFLSPRAVLGFGIALSLVVGSSVYGHARRAVAHAQSQFIVQTLNGDEAIGQIILLDDRQLVLATSEGDRSFAVDSLLQMTPTERVDTPAENTGVEVQLIDGTQLTGTELTAGDGRVRLKALAQDVVIPFRMMAHARFRKFDDQQTEQWKGALQAADASDLIVVRAGDNLDYLDVVIQAVTPDEVTVQVDGEERSLGRERVDGLIFANPNPPQLGNPLCILDIGLPIHVRTLKLTDQRLTVRTQSGISLALPLGSIRGYDFSAGKLMYLGDVEPDVMNVVKFLGPAFPLELEMHKPRRNQSPDGQPISIQSQVYRKGLGIRSKTELTYRLRGEYRRFEAIAGIDDEVRGRGGHVQLIIRGDDKVLFDEAVDDSRGAVPLTLDVSGVNRLTILVDFGENQGFADHLDLANARV
ncbi:MAG: NPCBM/NEW2 domain-containing protein, partial [Pirellulales bacterium]|nr:NPCBM/NEW2 domain-containing protein [Pirellulales bacterium]